MRRLLLCLPRSAKCADIRQIERCIDCLHVELLLSVLLAMACPVISSLSIPYIAYAVSLPYMCVSVAFRVLTKAATGSFRAVESLNRVFKAIGAANISLSGFSLILCGISSGTNSNWLYVVSLCFYTISLVFHIFIVTYATKMYSILRDEQIAVGGRCMGRSHIPDTCIDEIYNAQEDPAVEDRDIFSKEKPFLKRNNGVSGVLQQLGMDTPMDSSSVCISATVKEHKPGQQGTEPQASSTSSSILAEVTPTNSGEIPPISPEKESVGQSTPTIATSPNKNNIPNLPPNIRASVKKMESIPNITSLFEGLERVVEEHPMDVDSALITLPEHASPQQSVRGCTSCSGRQRSTPIARYSQLSLESDSTVP